MTRKIIKLILAVISISGLMLKRILIGLVMFGFPIGIAALAEANDANS